MGFRLVVICLLLAMATGFAVLNLRSTPPVPQSATTIPPAATIASPIAMLGDRPPVITASHVGQEQDGTLGSYCWNGCADTWALLVPAKPITVPLAARIQFRMTERVTPHSLLVTLFSVDASERMPFPDSDLLALGARAELEHADPRPATEFEFQMPDRAGDYALALWAVWQAQDLSSVDATYGFRIVVGDARSDGTPAAAPPAATPSPTSTPSPNNPAVDAVIARMSKYGMEDPRAVSVIAVTPMTWPDDCLGLPSGLPCHASPTAGYAIQVEKEGLRYIVRTDREGKLVRLASAPAVAIPGAFLQWQDNDGKECRTALIGAEQLQYGFCGEALLTEPSQAFMWPEMGGESLATYWQRTYAPFTANTVHGTVVFSGTGSRVATAAEQRAITEWARQRWEEHWWRYLDAVYDLDLGWTERNASFCGGLWIYRTGLAVAWNCEGSAALATRFLEGKQLEQFYTWLDSDKRWSIGPKDEIVGVPPNTSLYFLWDDSTQTATEQDTQEMLNFLHGVYSSLTSRASATGRIIEGYGAHETIAGLPLWVGDESGAAADATIDANGEFTLKHLPVGLNDVAGNHLRFQVPITSPNSQVNLGVLKYPLVHLPESYDWSPAPLASPSDLLMQGQPVTFTVCQSDPAWTRPTEDLQRAQVWSKRPFSDRGELFLRWWFRQPAVIYDTIDIFAQSFPEGPNLDALASDWRYLTGLWTGDDLSRSRCDYDGRTLEKLLNRGEIEVWLMGYRALEVRQIAMPSSRVPNRPIAEGHPDFLTIDQPSEHLSISVAPAPGFQIIRFSAHSDPLAVHVVQDGQELITLPKDCRSAFNPDCAN